MKNFVLDFIDIILIFDFRNMLSHNALGLLVYNSNTRVQCEFGV